MGRLYMREVSLRVDRYLVNTRVTPNQLTYLMTVFGVLAAPALLVPGIAGAVLGVVCVQMYLLLDCVDGEIARWKKQYSLNGVYLDRVGAYLTDAAVLTGFGLRAAEMRSSGMALARKAAAALNFHRLILGIEASLLILALAIVDQVRGDLFFSRLGVAVLAGIALVQTLLHLVSILASSRLK